MYYKRSAATVALDYFTAFFFPINLVAMPIAIPIEAQIEGNNGRDGIERAIHHALSTIETQLAQDDERDKDATEIQACFHAAALDPSLTSLSGLVALDDVRNQTSDMLASTKMPTEQERSAIKEWKDLIAPCYAQQEAFLNQWDVPPAIKALIGETKVASLNLRVLLYSGKLTYGEYALKREKVQDAFLTAEAKIEAELLERSEEAEARANTLAVQAQPSNSTALQSRQTVNQAIANNQQQQQTRELTKQLSRPQFTSCEFYSRYSVSCMSW
ncbi:MAG TPA: hypothetical protein DEP35_10545 [Deltaproteobacteria bacterium]|nr:hypothetical protein [Deltaproteobacteria bacterium]